MILNYHKAEPRPNITKVNTVGFLMTSVGGLMVVTQCSGIVYEAINHYFNSLVVSNFQSFTDSVREQYVSTLVNQAVSNSLIWLIVGTVGMVMLLRRSK